MINSLISVVGLGSSVSPFMTENHEISFLNINLQIDYFWPYLCVLTLSNHICMF